MRHYIYILLILFVLCIAHTHGNPCNHQTQTYPASIQPATVHDAAMTITTMYSPDSSLEVITALIDSAEKTIDIGTPHFKSWIPCGDSYHDGCEVDVLRNNETAPYWATLLNAIHRGVVVRIVSNDCAKYPKPHLIDPLAFLALGGAQVRGFTSTSFYHAKYIAVDGSRAAISSINLSESSFSKNRETGVIVEGNDAILGLYSDAFNYDFEHGFDWPVGEFSAAQKAIINDPTHIPVPPMPNTTSHCTLSPPPSLTFSGKVNATAFTMPDHAHAVLKSQLDSATDSFELYIYAINDPVECGMVMDVVKRGLNVSILVSSSTVGDFHLAAECYNNLTEAGQTVRMTQPDCLSFWHQKLWIIDGSVVSLSTGNLDEHDFPSPTSYPPPSSPDWVYTNRGYSINVESAEWVRTAMDLFDRDYSQGYDWKVSES